MKPLIPLDRLHEVGRQLWEISEAGELSAMGDAIQAAIDERQYQAESVFAYSDSERLGSLAWRIALFFGYPFQDNHPPHAEIKQAILDGHVGSKADVAIRAIKQFHTGMMRKSKARIAPQTRRGAVA